MVNAVENDIFIHIPWQHLCHHHAILARQQVQPEIAFKAGDLDSLVREQVHAVARELQHQGLGCTIHAPFMDLNPGALDPLVQEATRRRFHQTMDCVEILGARLVVFHPGYDRWRYGGQAQPWIDANLRFWPELIRRAEDLGCVMALENIFEETPDTLSTLLQTIDSPFLGACFDIGHWHLFGETDLDSWLQALGDHLCHLHLHDNHGSQDDHLALGKGKIDFPAFFDALSSSGTRPSITLEVHDPEGISSSLEYLHRLLGSDSQP